MNILQLFRSFSARLRRPANPLWRTVSPRLEALERRDVPTAFTNQAFVSSLYQGLLGTPPDSLGLSYWSGQLDAGATPVQVASGILASTEYRGGEVNNLYQALLGRPADSAGLNYWVGQLVSGSSLNQVKAGIFASDEFFARAGGTPTSFLNALYQDTLGRPLDDAGLAFYGPLVGTPTGRLQAAQMVLQSTEAGWHEVDDAYREFLGHPAGPAGLNYWGAILQSGVPLEAVQAGILGSAEYFDKLPAAATATTSDPDSAASQLIAANQLFQSSPLVPPQGTATQSSTSADIAAAVATLVQSAPVGPFSFPAGFNPFSPVTSIGLFGPNGFIPGNGLLTQGSSTGGSTGGTNTTNTNTVAPISFFLPGVINSLGGISTNGGLGGAGGLGSLTTNGSNSSILGTNPGTSPFILGPVGPGTSANPSFSNTGIVGFGGLDLNPS